MGKRGDGEKRIELQEKDECQLLDLFWRIKKQEDEDNLLSSENSEGTCPSMKDISSKQQFEMNDGSAIQIN